MSGPTEYTDPKDIKTQFAACVGSRVTVCLTVGPGAARADFGALISVSGELVKLGDAYRLICGTGNLVFFDPSFCRMVIIRGDDGASDAGSVAVLYLNPNAFD